MNEGYLWGGAVAGLVVIAVAGVVLAIRGAAIRSAVEEYIGNQPARWVLYVLWFAYVYGALSAVVAAFSQYSGLSTSSFPSALLFGYGATSQALLVFMRAIIPLVHIVALITVAYLLYRHLRFPTA